MIGIFKKKQSFGNSVEDANKLIFVKKYEEAFDLLEKIVLMEKDGVDLLLHLRRVELAHKIDKVKNLEDEYKAKLDRCKNPASRSAFSLCLLFCEQQNENITHSESIESYQKHISTYGDSAAAYYGIGYALECLNNYDRALYNYNLSINLDSDFYPAYFGLSQVYYLKQDETKGDHYFYFYEQAAPYNLYGNFETHKELCNEFLAGEHFDEAGASIKTLADWWVDNKGYLPDEIKVFQNFAFAEIAELQEKQAESFEYRELATEITESILKKENAKESTLYFIAKTLEDYNHSEEAYKFYVKILQKGRESGLIQKIGSQFFSVGEFDLAFKMFSEAYDSNPDNVDIRFCLLVADLKIRGINVEEYLLSKEKMRRLVRHEGDKVELLTLLHSLQAKYKEDPEVHAEMAEVYLNLGNIRRASAHYDKMLELDPAGIDSKLKFAEFSIQHKDADYGFEMLESIDPTSLEGKGLTAHVKWLKANYFTEKGDLTQAVSVGRSLLSQDPWSVSYLIHIIQALSKSLDECIDQDEANVFDELSDGREKIIDWADYDKRTNNLKKKGYLELAYFRAKVRFLYADGAIDEIANLVKIAKEYNPDVGIGDFLKLLNTNFHSANVLLALGMLCKELWSLETAIFWFNQVIHREDGLTDESRAIAFRELADCLVWKGMELARAEQCARIAMELGEDGESYQGNIVLAHALIKSGKVSEAKGLLSQVQEASKEKAFLLGLVAFRDGDLDTAKKAWKHLQGIAEETRKTHEMRKQIHGFLYQEKSYLAAS